MRALGFEGLGLSPTSFMSSEWSPLRQLAHWFMSCHEHEPGMPLLQSKAGTRLDSGENCRPKQAKSSTIPKQTKKREYPQQHGPNVRSWSFLSLPLWELVEKRKIGPRRLGRLALKKPDPTSHRTTTGVLRFFGCADKTPVVQWEEFERAENALLLNSNSGVGHGTKGG